MKRLICLLLILTLALPITAAVAENVGDSLVIGIYSTRTTELRPFNPQERDIISVYNLVYESLVTVDDNGLPQPMLADTWVETDNGKHIGKQQQHQRRTDERQCPFQTAGTRTV